MLAKYEAVCYELLRPAQVKAIREETPIVYVVAGSLEWHGFQNPLGTDGLKAHAICCEAALKHGGVVLPPLFRAVMGQRNWGPEGWAGYTLGYSTVEVFEATMGGTVEALVQAGWKVIVGVTGHDVKDQRDAMQRAIEVGTRDTGAAGFAMMEGELHEPDDAIPVRMDHAGAWETSCMMYAHPDKVDLDTLRDKPSVDKEQWKMSDAEGVGGMNPLKYASADLGRRIVEGMGELIGRRAREMLGQLGASGA